MLDNVFVMNKNKEFSKPIDVLFFINDFGNKHANQNGFKTYFVAPVNVHTCIRGYDNIAKWAMNDHVYVWEKRDDGNKSSRHNRHERTSSFWRLRIIFPFFFLSLSWRFAKRDMKNTAIISRNVSLSHHVQRFRRRIRRRHARSLRGRSYAARIT